jgi:hypothetical protein
MEKHTVTQKNRGESDFVRIFCSSNNSLQDVRVFYYCWLCEHKNKQEIMQRAFISVTRALRPVGVRAAGSSGHVSDTPGAFRERENALENQVCSGEYFSLCDRF